jgi:signal peptide peptidase SppA
MNPIVQLLLSDVPMLLPETVAAWLTPNDERERAFAGLADKLCSREPMGLRALREELKDPVTMTDDGIAIVPIKGAMANSPRTFEMLFMGLTDSSDVLANVRSCARNDRVKGMVLDIASPGGMHNGGPEIAEAVASCGKPTVAWAGGLMASLAYMIGSQADEIVASRSASVGSIGTFIAFTDLSRMLENAGVKVEVITNKEGRYKGAGVPGTALSEAHREYLQSRADAAFAEFKAMVRDRRPNVPDSAMQGQSFWAREAKEAGLVDRIGDLDFAVSLCRRRVRG